MTTQKREVAAKDLLRRYLAERSDLRRAGNYEPLRCDVKLDRIIITAREVPLQESGQDSRLSSQEAEAALEKTVPRSDPHLRHGQHPQNLHRVWPQCWVAAEI